MKDFELDHARWVTSVVVDEHGYVCELRGDGPWPHQSAQDAVTDIELAAHSYWVKWHDGPSEVLVQTEAEGVHLTTSHFGIDGNGLLRLPRHERAISTARAIGTDSYT